MTPLRQRMLDALVLHGKAARTQEAYIEAVAKLARHYRCSPDRLSDGQVQQYLLHLVQARHLARSSVNQAGCAFRFFYGTVLGHDDGEPVTTRARKQEMSTGCVWSISSIRCSAGTSVRAQVIR